MNDNQEDFKTFYPFPKIPRLNRACTITEKIDGTNAQIIIDPEGNISAASRNRMITPEDDNMGFARWVQENAEELKGLGTGRHFGEWWGLSIQRRYAEPKKIFSLFNVARFEHPASRPACCSVVPKLFEGQFSTDIVDRTLVDLRSNGSLASPGFMDPEGIVVFLHASKSMFKVTCKDDEKPKRDNGAS